MFLGSPPHRHTNPALSPLIATETSDTEITTTEIIKRRDVGPYGLRSEYCIRKIICPLGVPETPKGELVLFFLLLYTPVQINEALKKGISIE